VLEEGVMRVAILATVLSLPFLAGGATAFGQQAREFNIGGVTFACVKSAQKPMSRVSANREHYFVVLAAREGPGGARVGSRREGGPAFAMLIKVEGSKTQIETFGLYFDKNAGKLGPVPTEFYSQFIIEPRPGEPRSGPDAILRLEVTRSDYEKGLKIVQEWQRRAREDTLLFTEDSYLNCVVPLKEIAESLNQDRGIRLYKLDWSDTDEISSNYPASQIAFQYVKRLRSLNDTLNLADDKFHEIIGTR
jgi:hypothetical protein